MIGSVGNVEIGDSSLSDASKSASAGERERAMSLKTFAAEALADFPTIAAVAPSSSHLARAMLEPLPLGKASTVVELGAGTGVITGALLDVLPGPATLLAFEINRRFFSYLTRK